MFTTETIDFACSRYIEQLEKDLISGYLRQHAYKMFRSKENIRYYHIAPLINGLCLFFSSPAWSREFDASLCGDEIELSKDNKVARHPRSSGFSSVFGAYIVPSCWHVPMCGGCVSSARTLASCSSASRTDTRVRAASGARTASITRPST